MKQSGIKINSDVFFNGEKLPFKVKAFDGRFAVCTRNFDKKEDDAILSHKVEMNDYFSKKEAFNDLQNEVVYTLIDFKNVVRSTNDFVFNPYDFKKDEDIKQCLSDLKSGECKLSERNKIHLNIDKVIWS